MDNSRNSGVRLWSIPVGFVITVVIAVFWLPFYDAIVHGQVTPFITFLLALAIRQKPFVRGLLVGLAAALKPPFVILLPFVSLSFGWKALAGSMVGALFGAIPPGLFFEYVNLLPELQDRVYGDIGLVRIFGLRLCLVATFLACLFITMCWKGEESSYIGMIAAVVIGTSLWFHSYTPLVIPAIYFSTRWIDRYFPLPDETPNQEDKVS